MKFERSTRKNKKYMVTTPSGKKIVHFGDTRYQHYRDSTGLKLYSNLDHLDKKRRDNYRTRHKSIMLKNGKPAYLDREQPAYWSFHYLWT